MIKTKIPKLKPSLLILDDRFVCITIEWESRTVFLSPLRGFMNSDFVHKHLIFSKVRDSILDEIRDIYESWQDGGCDEQYVEDEIFWNTNDLYLFLSGGIYTWEYAEQIASKNLFTLHKIEDYDKSKYTQTVSI
jgi:hypothetical protein